MLSAPKDAEYSCILLLSLSACDFGMIQRGLIPRSSLNFPESAVAGALSMGVDRRLRFEVEI